MKFALVKDSNGKKWIIGGDGFTSIKRDLPFSFPYHIYYFLAFIG